MFHAHLLVIYVASVLVGCFYGPLYPSIMAVESTVAQTWTSVVRAALIQSGVASRRFVHVIGPVTSILISSTDATSMIVPAAMGLLIPALGINWVMAIPAFCCLFVFLPMTLANRAQPEAQTGYQDG